MNQRNDALDDASVADDSSSRRSESYYDDTAIEIRPVEYPDNANSNETWFINFSGAINPDWLRREVEWLGYTQVRDEAGNVVDRVNPIFDLQVTEKTTCWGFDSAQINMMLQVPLAASSTLLALGIASLCKKVAQNMRTGASSSNLTRLGESEAAERARWLISQRYGIESDQLELVASEVISDAAHVSLAGPAGTRYLVDLTVHDDLVSVVKLRREINGS